MSKHLPADRIGPTLQAIADWRSKPDEPVACPVCGAAGLGIADRSARPHAEWYHLACAACGLDHTLHIPLAAPVATLD